MRVALGEGPRQPMQLSDWEFATNKTGEREKNVKHVHTMYTSVHTSDVGPKINRCQYVPPGFCFGCVFSNNFGWHLKFQRVDQPFFWACLAQLPALSFGLMAHKASSLVEGNGTKPWTFPGICAASDGGDLFIIIIITIGIMIIINCYHYWCYYYYYHYYYHYY